MLDFLAAIESDGSPRSDASQAVRIFSLETKLKFQHSLSKERPGSYLDPIPIVTYACIGEYCLRLLQHISVVIDLRQMGEVQALN